MNMRLIDIENLICSRDEGIVGIPAWWENVKNGACPQYEILMRSKDKVGIKYVYRYFYVPYPNPNPNDRDFPEWVAGRVNAQGIYPDGRYISVYTLDEAEGERIVMALHAKTTYPNPPAITIIKSNRAVHQIAYIPYRIRYIVPENQFGDYEFETKLVTKTPNPNV